MNRKTTQSQGDLLDNAIGTDRQERMTLAEKRNKLFDKFYSNIRVLSARETVSMVEIARATGLKSGKRLYDFCYGKCVPSTEELIVLSAYFKCTMDEILNKTAKVYFD